ncbi:MAG TPA: TonB family protein [Candidatus Sulfotelmatobacter sp.]|nr:TonB family protein [Candidatus Sulfotelmatobacter sp.]
MSEIWKQWEGQVVDHKYQLREYLGSTDHSVVFYAEYRDPEPCKAAVKFVPGNLPHAEELLADWKRAAQLNHPNLLRIYATGRYKVEDTEVLYAAMEYAEENLGQILPQRALTKEETREMLSAVADALGFLHGQNLTHGHIKPSNIFAVGDQLKVSSDTIQPVSEQREMRRQRDAYDAPEIPSTPYSPAADIWSLGVTVVEALTQQHAVMPFKEDADPVIPATVREPFLEIARQALRRDPKSRWSSAQIAERLNPAAAAAASAKAAAAMGSTSSPVSPAPPAVATAPPAPPSASQGPAVSPLSVPLSKEPAVPLAKQSSAPAAAARPPMALPPLPPPAAKTASRQTVVLPNYVVPLLAAVLVLIGIIALPKILHRRAESEASSVSATAPPATINAPAAQPSASVRRVEPAPKQPAHVNAGPSNSGKSAAPESSTTTSTQTLPSAPAPAPATLRGTEAKSSAAPKTASALPGRGEVLDQVLPRPSSAALATVQGTVRVLVKVRVDAAGNVAEALLESPSPSKYFADQSVQAARGWVFNSPEVEGHSVPSEWSIRFEFTSSGVRAYPRQTKP